MLRWIFTGSIFCLSHISTQRQPVQVRKQDAACIVRSRWSKLFVWRLRPATWMNECFFSISLGACWPIIWNNISCSPLARHSFSNAHGRKTVQCCRSLWMDVSGPPWRFSSSGAIACAMVNSVASRHTSIPSSRIRFDILGALLWTSFFFFSVSTGRIHHVRKLMCPNSGAIVNYGAAHFGFRFPSQKPTSIKVKNLDAFKWRTRTKTEKIDFVFCSWSPWPICAVTWASFNRNQRPRDITVHSLKVAAWTLWCWRILSREIVIQI